MNNIFQAAETVIHTNALGKMQVKNAAYASFDEVIEFSWDKNLLEILSYLKYLDEKYLTVRLVIEEILTN